MKNFQVKKLSRQEMKTVLGGVLQMDCYCLDIHGTTPTGAMFGCVTPDGCVAAASSVCSTGNYTCGSVGNPV